MILMVDNYDSFTYNLVQLLWAEGVEVEVLRNDVESAENMLARGPSGIVLSPGPGRPEDAGVCLDLVGRSPEVPILGVCLGHQVLAQADGGIVETAPELLHGKTSRIRHTGVDVFEGIPVPFEATRYHSLCVREESLPTHWEAIAWSDDDVLQGMRHRERPYWGVQFHPESVLTPDGPELMRNFLERCR